MPRFMSRKSFLLGIAILLLSGGAAAVPPASLPVTDEASVLFDKTVLPVFDLTVDPRDWNWLQLNAKDKKTVPAVLRVDGRDVGKVGLRYKGSYGTLYPCLGEKGPTCRKLSLKIKFDRYDPALRFHGLKTLNLNSLIRDPSLLREPLAYWVYREMGVPAPRARHVRVTVNGEYRGLFLMVEQVDREFLRSRFPTAEGELYKEAWPVSKDPAYYAGKVQDAVDDPDGDDGKDPDPGKLIEFGRELATADGKKAAETLARWVDVDGMMRYLAADCATRNWDGVTAFYYTGNDPYGNHNYYWYLDPATGFFRIIPWDMDLTFQLRATYGKVPSWHSEDRDCSRRYSTSEGGITVSSPACDPLFRALASGGLGPYRKYLRAALEGPLREGVPEAKIDGWAAAIDDSVRGDPNGPAWESWRQEVGKLQETLRAVRQIVRAEEKGKVLAPMELSWRRNNGLEDLDELQVLMGVNGMCNPNSSLAFGLDRKDPIRGKKDLRADFVFRNEQEGPEGAWQQWCQLTLALEALPGGADLSGGRKLRMKVRADRERNMRVTLDSPKYVMENTMNGVTYGWETQLGPDVRTLEFEIEQAAYPSWARVRPDVKLADVVRSVGGITFSPQAVGRNAQGLFPEGAQDAGWIQVDDIEFVKP